MEQARKIKIDAYLAEITAVNKRFLFNIIPKIKYTDKGIFPIQEIEDMLPPKEEPKKEEPHKTEPVEPVKPEEVKPPIDTA